MNRLEQLVNLARERGSTGQKMPKGWADGLSMNQTLDIFGYWQDCLIAALKRGDIDEIP